VEVSSVSPIDETLGEAIADPLLIADPGGHVVFMNASGREAFGGIRATRSTGCWQPTCCPAPSS
jgi:hypothetical protein